MDTEVVEWRDIAGFNKYEISNEGKVKNKNSSKEVKPQYDGKYWRIGLITDTKNDEGKFPPQRMSLHKLIAETFIENENERQRYVDHIDSNRDNYDMENLRWVTASENKSYGHDAKGRKAILQLNMQGELIKRWESATAIKEAHPDFSVHHISSCCLGREHRKSHKKFKWAYETETVKKVVRDLYEDEIFVNIGTFDEFDFQDYFVSNYGLVKNSRGMMLTGFEDRGYVVYTLYDKRTGKSHQIKAHRAVAFKFCPGRTEERNIVNHRDEVRNNNKHTNLEWLTQKENAEYSLSVQVEKLNGFRRELPHLKWYDEHHKYVLDRTYISAPSAGGLSWLQSLLGYASPRFGNHSER